MLNSNLDRKRILLVVGTRPEGIKMAPVYWALRNRPDRFEPLLCSTGQHVEMLDDVLDLFNIEADYRLELLRQGQDLIQLTSRALAGLRAVLLEAKPDMVLCQGDTTSALCAALAAFYMRIPVGHVEAGLRTYDPWQPYPEESNRRLIAPLASVNFAPTETARENLLNELIPADTIHVTGNTSIDALKQVLAVTGEQQDATAFQQWYQEEVDDGRCILVTGHRRENWGDGLENICLALRETVEEVEDVSAIYPVHLNPSVQTQVHSVLGEHPRVHLLPPLDYADFVWLMDQAHIVLTDSGGIQEEAPGLGKPVLVARNKTERPEGVEAGTARLVGTSVSKIHTNLRLLLTQPEAYEVMAKAVNPYGDGQAAERIADVLEAKGRVVVPTSRGASSARNTVVASAKD